MDFLSWSSRGTQRPAEENEDNETRDARLALDLIDNLNNNFNIFYDKLELTRSVRSVNYVDLLRALCYNTTVRYVTIESGFLNTFSVDETRILLEVIGGVPKLETLTVHFAPDVAVTCQAMAEVLRRSKTLKELHLFDLLLSGDEDDMEPLGESLEKLNSLKRISFRQIGLVESQNDEFEPISPNHIINSIVSLPALEEVVFIPRRRLAFDEDSLGGLCESKTLKSLRIKNVALDSSQVSALAESLQENTTLLHLQLSDCAIDVDGWRAIASFLPSNKTLQVLDLSQSSSLDDDGCFVIGSCMEGNTGLKVLRLQSNSPSEVTSQGATTLFRMLEKNSTLECLELSYAANDDIAFKAAAEALQRNSSLKQLYVENFGISVSTRGVVAIGAALESNKTIEMVGIVFDGADSKGVLALAQAMQKSPSLKHTAFNREDYISSMTSKKSEG